MLETTKIVLLGTSGNAHRREEPDFRRCSRSLSIQSYLVAPMFFMESGRPSPKSFGLFSRRLCNRKKIEFQLMELWPFRSGLVQRKQGTCRFSKPIRQYESLSPHPTQLSFSSRWLSVIVYGMWRRYVVPLSPLSRYTTVGTSITSYWSTQRS